MNTAMSTMKLQKKIRIILVNGISMNVYMKSPITLITSLFQLYGDKIHGEVDVVIYKGDKDKVTLDI